MMDPISTPLLLHVLGKVAHELITDACKDHLKDKLKSLFGWLEKLGERSKVERAYQDAMEQAYAACLEMLLLNIKSFGYSDEELRQYRSSLEAFIKDAEVAGELLSYVRDPGRKDLPSPEVLRNRWNEVADEALPDEGLWNIVAVAFRRRVTKKMILSEQLRDILNAENIQQLKEMVERQGGVKVVVRSDKYSQRMLTKYSPVDLANLMPAYADDPGQMVIRDVFVAQNVREDPPPVEIPKDLAVLMKGGKRAGVSEKDKEKIEERRLEQLHAAYARQSPRPVLEVIAGQGNRLLVLTGEPGSGKSTLMRYLLTGIIDKPRDCESGEPLPWTAAFENAFPLLIELRDFYAVRRSGDCDSFLEYVAYMGTTDHWALDDHAADEHLQHGPSLVMFDGLDEIFDNADRERVMQEIAGFAQHYPRARIVVTSRSVGYKDGALRNAGFGHFGIQDLADEQIETFVRGWFALTFPQNPKLAAQRIDRVLGSVTRSRPIRLLAGNPMLLTIMALLAREDELPRERAKFYEKAVEVLCHHWDANKNLELSDDRYLNAEDKKGLLRRIAMRMQTGSGGLKGNVIAVEELEEEIQAYLIDEQLHTDAGNAKRAARRVIHQLRERNYILCLRGAHLYGFVHRTFLEYLTAAEYVQRFDKQPQQMSIEELIGLFETHCRDDGWQEVLRLICGQIDGQYVGQIVERLAERTDMEKRDGHRDLPELLLAIWCLSEVRNPGKLASASETLFRACMKFFERPKLFRAPSPWSIVSAANEVSVWACPRPRSLVLDWPDNVHIWSSAYWIPFVAAVFRDRDMIEQLRTAEHFALRMGVCRALAERWPDEKTRRFLEESAIKDEKHEVRRESLRALTKKWPDETTRSLIERRAVEDERCFTPVDILQTLSETWPDDRTRTFLRSRALDVSLTSEVRGPYCIAFAGMHSEFGRLVYTIDVDGFAPYLGPIEPVSRAQIEKAAEAAGVAAGEIDEVVRSLSEHLGWDIRKGLAVEPG